MIFFILIALLVFSLLTDKSSLGAISLLAILVYSIYYVIVKIKTWLRKESPKTTVSVHDIKVTAGTDDGTYYTKIAGVQYRNSKKDEGGFLGYVRSEPNNQHDRNAIAIYRNDNKLLGYIPKDEQKTFRSWSRKENIPCIGFIKEGDEVALFGKVKVIDTDECETELIIVSYVKWLISNFGIRFIPVGFNVNTDDKLRTKEDWIQFLSKYIEEKEEELYEEA